MRSYLKLLYLVLCIAFSTSTFSAPPETITYQGYLSNSSGVPLQNDIKLEIRLYDVASGGSALWTSFEIATLTNGRFTLILDGSSSGSNPFPNNLFDQQLYIGLTVVGDPEMSPRQALTSVPSAFVALQANSAANADTVDGLNANEIITAAADEVRTPISSLPFTVNQSGSYYLTQNLDGTAGGIDITAANVTIDLMGFTMDGNGVTDYGIFAEDTSIITIKNGTIREFNSGGIRITEDDGSGHSIMIEDIKALDNLGVGGIGIYLEGEPAQVKNCLAKNNGSHGIFINDNSQIIESIAASNSGFGIRAGTNSVLVHNTVRSNTGIGLYGGLSSVIKDNSAYQNGLWGISSGGSNIIIGNSAAFNNTSSTDDTGGILVLSDSLVVNNSADSNRHSGIRINSTDNVLRDNHATDTTSLSGDSFCFDFAFQDNVAIGNTATGCTVEFQNPPPAARFVDNIGW